MSGPWRVGARSSAYPDTVFLDRGEGTGACIARCYHPEMAQFIVDACNDAEARALVKKYRLHTWQSQNHKWHAQFSDTGMQGFGSSAETLNDAIFRCVAQVAGTKYSEKYVDSH